MINFPCRASNSANAQNTVAIDVSKKQKDGDLKLIAFASCYSNEAGKRYGINKLKFLCEW